MSTTACIHGIPVDPWYIHCDKCQDMSDPTSSPLPPERTANPADYHPWQCGANCEVCADR